MPRLIPQVGDIWLYDTSAIYREHTGYYKREHWLILMAGPVNNILNEKNLGYYESRDFAVRYLHLETGRYDLKIFYNREWSQSLDLTGNPYYKKVA